jgi:hypothetical protein
VAFSKVSSSSSSSLETYLGGEHLDFLLLILVLRQVCFPLLRLGNRDLLEEEEESLIAMMTTPSLSESELSSLESFPMCASP